MNPAYCKATGCCVQLTHRNFDFCRSHWALVPEPIKIRIEASRFVKSKSWEFRSALIDAVDAVDAREACRPSPGLTVSRVLALFVCCLFLVGCSGSDEETFQRKGFKELPTATQIAIILNPASIIVAMGFLMFGMSGFKRIQIIKHKKK